ncbi:conjugal transfer protein TraO [Aquimarina agarilytica]|uniref:conjugal transfer protein TraO n=1 Tax=Aquimarina agarilytica TaxID=1087449 RepID=UPI0002882086|nr:conjugal transfer protein TraO [Aquimarina agarilytica]
MKKLFFSIAVIAMAQGAFAQNETELQKQSEETLHFQLNRLQMQNKQIENELKLLQKSYSTRSFRLMKKEKSRKTTYASFETIIGITDNEGLGYQANFSIEIDTDKNKGLEMGLYYDNNDLLAKELEIPSEVFILNLGYTKQLSFLSNKTSTITTRFTIGGAVGAELLNDGKDKLSNGAILETEDGLIYGGYTGIFSLFKINNNLSAVFRNSNFFTTSDVSLHKFIIGAGIRYHF